MKAIIQYASDCRTGNDIDRNVIDRVEEIKTLEELLEFMKSEENPLIIDNLDDFELRPEDQELCKGADFVILVYNDFIE
jgi:hypothetical protein